MNTHNYDTGPAEKPKAAESTATPKKAELTDAGAPNALLGLVREILSLLENGQDEPRLRQLLVTLDAEHLRQIDKNLAMLHEGNLDRLLELKQNCAEMIKPIKAEAKRTDLTIPEMLFLRDFSSQQLRQEQIFLLIEKERIEQKRRPDLRHRRPTN